jgi:hypothetical protein
MLLEERYRDAAVHLKDLVELCDVLQLVVAE